MHADLRGTSGPEIDNVLLRTSDAFVPEPTTLVLAIRGLLGLLTRWRRWGAALAIICAFMIASDGFAASRDEAIDVGAWRQLFVDDDLIAGTHAMRRVLHQPTKHPANPLIVPDRRWEGTDIYLYGTVMRDRNTGQYRMWYQSWRPALMNYAVSDDGIHWEKPALGLGMPGENVIERAELYAVIHTPDDPDPNRQYKRLQYLGPGSYCWGAFFSPDGFRWTGLPDKGHQSGFKPVLQGAECCSVVFDEQSGRFVAFPKLYEFVPNAFQEKPFERRSTAVAFSDDFVKWTEPKMILVPDARDDELASERVIEARNVLRVDDGKAWHHAHFYVMSGFPYQGIYLGLLSVLDVSGGGGTKKFTAGGEDGPVQVELVSSRDLVSWHRVADRALFIPRGPDDAFDASTIYTSNRPVILDDEIRIYYGGIKHSHGSALYSGAKKEDIDTGSGIGLATLRLDGWVSMDAGREPGTLTTKLLRLQGNRVVINAVAPLGSVRVEMLDRNGKTIPGFAAGDCDPFTGDALRHVMTWSGAGDVSALAGQCVRLRFHLQSAALYSFAFQK